MWGLWRNVMLNANFPLWSLFHPAIINAGVHNRAIRKLLNSTMHDKYDRKQERRYVLLSHKHFSQSSTAASRDKECVSIQSHTVYVCIHECKPVCGQRCLAPLLRGSHVNKTTVHAKWVLLFISTLTVMCTNVLTGVTMQPQCILR